MKVGCIAVRKSLLDDMLQGVRLSAFNIFVSSGSPERDHEETGKVPLTIVCLLAP